MDCKIDPHQIGYYGRPVDTLSREELLEMVSEMADMLMHRAQNGDTRHRPDNARSLT